MLRYRHPGVVRIAVHLLGAVAAMWFAFNASQIQRPLVQVVALASLAVGAVFLGAAIYLGWQAQRPSPVIVDASGLIVRLPGRSSHLPWAAIDAVILESRAVPSNYPAWPLNRS